MSDEACGIPVAANPLLEIDRLTVRDVAAAAREWLTFERLRQELLNQGAPDPLIVSVNDRDVEHSVIALLDKKRPAEEIERTWRALLRALKGNPTIARLRFAKGGTEYPASKFEPHALQTMLTAREDLFARWHDFPKDMERVGLAVCRIHIHDVFSGTGFLISDRHVLTTFHGIESLVDANGLALPQSHKKLAIVFDDIVIPGSEIGSCRLSIPAAPDWLVCQSRYDEAEDTAPEPLDRIKDGRLDYAVIRLSEPAGNMASKYLKGAVRRWIDLDDLASPPAQQAQMLLAHYPGGIDLRLCVGLFGSHSNGNRRIRYLTPTVVGSSGAPCFTVDWKPYALHNAGYDEVPINQGVPLSLIRDAIAKVAELKRGQEIKPRFIPAVSTDGSPILGREDVAQQLEAALYRKSGMAAMVIVAPPRKGKTFTGDLIRAILIDRGVPAFIVDAETFAADTPELFARRLVSLIAGADRANNQPDAPDARQRARWITNSLAEWTKSRASVDGTTPAAQEVKDSVWVIFDRCDEILFSQETHDLLIALIGEDAGTASPLRFVLLGYGGDLSSIAPEKVWRTELDLLSVRGALPFIDHTLASVFWEGNEGAILQTAEKFVDDARMFGAETIPAFVNGLVNWSRKQKATLTRAADDQGRGQP